MPSHARNTSNRRWLKLLWLGSLCIMACSHTQTVGDTSSGQSTKPHAEGKVDRGSSNNHGQHEGKQTSTTEEDSASKQTPPLAMSPAGLLKPGAVDSIQEKLADKGYLKTSPKSDDKLDASTQTALRAFQTDNNLPATGIPDDLTVQKLGLSPSDIFRAAEKR